MSYVRDFLAPVIQKQACLPPAREWKRSAFWLEFQTGPWEEMHTGGEESKETGVKLSPHLLQTHSDIWIHHWI